MPRMEASVPCGVWQMNFTVHDSGDRPQQRAIWHSARRSFSLKTRTGTKSQYLTTTVFSSKNTSQHFTARHAWTTVPFLGKLLKSISKLGSMLLKYCGRNRMRVSGPISSRNTNSTVSLRSPTITFRYTYCGQYPR